MTFSSLIFVSQLEQFSIPLKLNVAKALNLFKIIVIWIEVHQTKKVEAKVIADIKLRFFWSKKIMNWEKKIKKIKTLKNTSKNKQMANWKIILIHKFKHWNNYCQRKMPTFLFIWNCFLPLGKEISNLKITQLFPNEILLFFLQKQSISK